MMKTLHIEPPRHHLEPIRFFIRMMVAIVCKVLRRPIIGNLHSSLDMGAGRAWGLVCTLVVFCFCMTAPAMAVPPGTVISNTVQAAYRSWGTPTTASSNTATFTTDRLNTSSQIEFLQYAPMATGATPILVPTTAYSDTGTTSSSVTISAIYPAGSASPIDTSVPVPLINAGIYHQSEPVFLRVDDMDQNLYPTVADTVWVIVNVPGTGEAELLLLTETGPDTGVFMGYIQSGNLGAGSVDDFNGLLDVQEGGQLEARYTDAFDAADTVLAAALVDPFGMVFDSATGLPVDNAQLTLVVDATGAPATVYGDDGVSTFPSTITSGGTFVDGSGKVYAFASGRYRFPFVAPGTYRLVVAPPSGFAAPSTVPTATLQTLPGGPFVIADPGSRGEAFVLNPGPAIRMDIPVDPAATGLWLKKSVNREIAAIGDFVQYTVVAENRSGALAPGAVVTDLLPTGFRYRKGSFRLNGAAQADPQISTDGRTLTFTIGNLAADAAARIQYVTEIAAGTPLGKAENRASATAVGGLSSNSATAVVKVKEDLIRTKNFIIGRVIADNCSDKPTDLEDGIAGVRIYLEDGRYVVTDAQGRYHFEGLSSGTHVVQIDLETLPDRVEPALCEDDTRTAATPFSRFVELFGGTLRRADFHLQTKTPPSGKTQLMLSCGLGKEAVEYTAEIQVREVAVDNLRLTTMLPEGGTYLPGSSRSDTRKIEDPQVMGNVLIYRLGHGPAGHVERIHFKVRLGHRVQPGQLHTKALMTFNTPRQKNQRTAVIDTVLSLSRRETRQVQTPLVVRPRFASLSAELTEQDRQMLDRLVERLKDLDIQHVDCIGHTDNRRIRPDRRRQFQDNLALSILRARNVAGYLTTRLGLSASQVTVHGKGADHPVASNATEKGRAQNRRVEVNVTSVKTHWTQEIASIKCQDSVAADTQGEHVGQANPSGIEEKTADVQQDIGRIDLEALSPGFAVVMPQSGFLPAAPGLKLAVKHGLDERVELLHNGQPVSPFHFQGQKYNAARTVALSIWRGVDLKEGDNHFIAICKDGNGAEEVRVERSVHYSGPPVKAEWVAPASRLVANGKDRPLIAIRFTDKDGYPVRRGIVGTYHVLPPHQAYVPKPQEDREPLVAHERAEFMVGADGIARLKLEPTTISGYATVTIPMADRDQEFRVWLRPELRDWILVGLAEGTAGYNTVSGNMENLTAGDQEDAFYQDGRVAFFAKGRIKGKWLLTAAYDSGREREDNDIGLFQTVDPDTYYTLYGDAAQQQNEAASIRKLYLKVERDQFYALFGDFDTGMTVTELSKYSRRFNGIKSEYRGSGWELTAFATDSDQAFIKDEIRGDGTSGLYRLSRKNIVPNSETVTIETRDRFRSEIIISSQTLARHIDYNIDTDAGTLSFKSPVYSRDADFNPIFIVVDYESRDTAESSYSYGGRGSVQLAGGKVEVGTTYVHEGQGESDTDLAGVDTRIEFGDGLTARAEVAATRKDDFNGKRNGHAMLAEVSQQSDRLSGKVYFREQGEDFGLGQQNGSEAATRKLGADAAWRMNDTWRLSGELYRQHHLTTDAQRDLGEARVEFHRPVYDLYSGLRLAEDRKGSEPAQRSTQLLAGASRRFMGNRLNARISHEQSLSGSNESVDFPTRTTIGADYKLVDPVTLFAEHEIARGESETSQSSRLGVKATPWSGGQLGSSVGREYTESGHRLFANLGLNQTWRISDRWSIDGGLDRTQTFDRSTAAPFNTNVPTAAGAEEDFASLSLGAAYRAQAWSWTGRVESRTADSEDKWGLITGIAGEVRPGLALSAGVSIFDTGTLAGSDTRDGDIRFSLAFRPKNTRWIVLDRLDYKFEQRRDAEGAYKARRIVNNLNANYQPHHKLQVALQYGAKYVFDTFDDRSYSGYTDLTGFDLRYDISRRWDAGLHVSLLHAWDAGQMDYRTGCSVGYAVMKNMWVSLGYNFTGFRDEDFSAADYTAAGPFLKMRIKFDQQSVKEMVSWFDAK
jgi:uncharacterized repeat protein (TIGR01451 family)